MSLDKGYFGNLKSRNSKNFSLNLNISKNKNLSIFPNKSINYNNELIKNNKYSNYKNNIAINTCKSKNNDKNNYNKNTSQLLKNSQTIKNKEKVNQTYNPVVTVTSGESTINSSTKGAKRQEPFFYEPTSKNTINPIESAEESKKKLKEPENEDIKFLYTIFYNYNNNSINKKNKLNFNDLRNYLIINEKNFKKEGNILLYQSSRASGLVLDFYFIKKLENLIARFSLIIFIFIQNDKFDQARDIFLLMLKENRIYLDFIEKKVNEYYSVSNKNINIAKDYPRMTYELIRIYSFIIKYSQFFNIMNYRNIFLGRYFELLYFIYNFFIQKGNTRMFNLETKNQLSYWFSFAIHNVIYYVTSNYIPLNLPINLSNYIINLYQGFEDHILTDLEKSLIIKTFYNLGLFNYLDGKKDEALFNLDKAKDRITNSEENDIIDDNSFYQMNIKKKDSINILVPKKKSENNIFNNSTTEDNILSNRLSTNNSISEHTKNNNFNNNNDDESTKKESEKNKLKRPTLIEKIIKGFSKKKNDLEDIKLLINYGMKNGLITEINKPENEYKHKYRKIFRGSHINLSTTFRVKDFLIPYYFNNPLLRKIELLMGEIELDKKNYISAYSHVLRAFYILISLKINRTSGNQKEFSNEQKIIDKYLTLIGKYKDEEMKNNERIKTDLNLKDNNIYINSNNISKDDSFQENCKDELNDIVMDKYNLTSEEIEEKNEEENQEILICGKKIIDNKVLKEIEKFFIFLNSLSLFQIKILNEAQPDNIKRNDLPILFPSQFKDRLSNIQRIELDNLQTMALSRFVVLKDPNKWIMPNNLNIDIINKNEIKKLNEKKHFKYLIKHDLKYIPIKKTKEYKYYQKIITSEKSNKEIREFINTNFDLVIKILKQSSEEEIENIINFPYIIIEPVKNYKKKRKQKFLKLKKEGYNISEYENEKFNYLLINNSYDYDDYDPRTGKGRLRTYSTRYKNNRLNEHHIIQEKEKRNFLDRYSQRNRSRNKSLYNKAGPKLKQSSKDSKIDDLNDYNDSYEDNLISPDISLDNKS